jgi:hypothetical protein
MSVSAAAMSTAAMSAAAMPTATVSASREILGPQMFSFDYTR